MEIWSKSKACQICALGCSTGESLHNTTVRKHCSKCRRDIIAMVEGIMAHNDLQCPQYLCSDDVTSDNSSIKDVCNVDGNVLPLVSELRDETPCGLTKKLLIA